METLVLHRQGKGNQRGRPRDGRRAQYDPRDPRGQERGPVRPGPIPPDQRARGPKGCLAKPTAKRPSAPLPITDHGRGRRALAN